MNFPESLNSCKRIAYFFKRGHAGLVHAQPQENPFHLVVLGGLAYVARDLIQTNDGIQVDATHRQIRHVKFDGPVGDGIVQVKREHRVFLHIGMLLPETTDQTANDSRPDEKGQYQYDKPPKNGGKQVFEKAAHGIVI